MYNGDVYIALQCQRIELEVCCFTAVNTEQLRNIYRQQQSLLSQCLLFVLSPSIGNVSCSAHGQLNSRQLVVFKVLLP